MPFAPGQSGNPGGRPKESARIKALAQSHAERAIKKLAELIDSDDEKTAISAASAILDRGLGKPAQAVIGGDEDDPAIRTLNEILIRAVDANRSTEESR